MNPKPQGLTLSAGLYRGTSLYAALGIIASQELDVDRIAAHQLEGGGVARGVFIASQRGTAQYYADLWYNPDLSGGPGVVTISVPKADFISFVVRHGILVEQAVPTPPTPGQTETLLPFETIPEFDSIATYYP